MRSDQTAASRTDNNPPRGFGIFGIKEGIKRMKIIKDEELEQYEVHPFLEPDEEPPPFDHGIGVRLFGYKKPIHYNGDWWTIEGIQKLISGLEEAIELAQNDME
jgi:hypothetical protein